jgi:hypothetical protein
MNFTSQDIVLIEKALHTAIQQTASEQAKSEYREVLLKLQDRLKEALHAGGLETLQAVEGFRYDYDDSSDLV